ncbi:MAG: hypothetical protein V1859_02815 [archaeon]
MKKIFLFFFLLFLISPLILTEYKREFTSGDRREKVLSELSLLIKEAESEGKYKCCIEPPCTMCYLGNWLWEDGSCYCDDMIAKGEYDKVCPECKKGLEDGVCKSSVEKPCNLESGEIFRPIGS